MPTMVAHFLSVRPAGNTLARAGSGRCALPMSPLLGTSVMGITVGLAAATGETALLLAVRSGDRRTVAGAGVTAYVGAILHMRAMLSSRCRSASRARR